MSGQPVGEPSKTTARTYLVGFLYEPGTQDCGAAEARRSAGTRECRGIIGGQTEKQDGLRAQRHGEELGLGDAEAEVGLWEQQRMSGSV